MLVPAILLGLFAVVTIAIVSGRTRDQGSDTGAPKGVLGPGAASPTVTLPATTGQTVDLATFRGRRNVLLYFYEHAG
ncbi:MAG TPA: hypothetical protein VJ010_03950 [Actinomycetota bacterium]|nr:hypothetical protein [Acidimicrobiia bacterium]HKN49361.1 hypothetical protein [Actinomycetota bacterium]